MNELLFLRPDLETAIRDRFDPPWVEGGGLFTFIFIHIHINKWLFEANYQYLIILPLICGFPPDANWNSTTNPRCSHRNDAINYSRWAHSSIRKCWSLIYSRSGKISPVGPRWVSPSYSSLRSTSRILSSFHWCCPSPMVSSVFPLDLSPQFEACLGISIYIY